MNKFLKKLLIFALLLALLAQSKIFLDIWSGPYWANKVVNAKISYIKEAPRFDIMFFGSSRTYRQIVPRVIDSLLGVKSFNLGSGGTWNPEAWYIIDHLLEDLPEEKKPKYLIIELQRTLRIASKNEGTSRSEYCLDFKRMSYVTKHFLEQQDSSIAKTYFVSFIRKNLFMSTLGQQVKSTITMKTDNKKTKNEIVGSAGYLSLESDIEKGHLNRRNDLLRNPNSLLRRKEKIINEYMNDNHKPSGHEIKLHKEIAELCKTHDIIPIFYKPPRVQQILRLYNTIDYVFKIDLSDPAIYPQFYSIENSYDLGHMNTKGSELYTLELAKKLAEIID